VRERPHARELLREPSKKMRILLVYGGDDAVSSGAVNAIRSLQDALGIDLIGMAHGSAWEVGSVRGNERLMQQVFDLGKDIANRLQCVQQDGL